VAERSRESDVRSAAAQGRSLPDHRGRQRGPGRLALRGAQHRPGGTCTCTSLYTADVALPLLAMYSRGLTFRIGRVHARPCVPAVLELVGAGSTHPW